MIKVMVDTDIVLDLLAKREPFQVESRKIFSLADTNEIQLVVSSLTIVNTHYVLSARLKIREARSVLRKFKVLVHTYELNDKIIELALNDTNFKDFEDAIQYYTALEAQCKIILTRNLKDFKKSTLPVLSPREFLTKIKSGR